MNSNLLLLKLSTQENQILSRETFTETSIDLTDFDCSYLNKLLENISEEQKSNF